MIGSACSTTLTRRLLHRPPLRLSWPLLHCAMSDPFPSFNLRFLNLPANATLVALSTAVKAKRDALMPGDVYPGNVKQMRYVLWKLGIKDSVAIGYERCSALRGKGVWGIVEEELLATA